MAIGGSIVNSPSDPYERKVSNALLVMSDFLNVPLSKDIKILGITENLFVGDTYNAYISDNKISKENIIWGMKGSIGFIDQNGKLTVTKAGKAEITARIGTTLLKISVTSNKK